MASRYYKPCPELDAATGVPQDMAQARHWYRQAALQNHDLALQKCGQLGIPLEEGKLPSEST